MSLEQFLKECHISLFSLARSQQYDNDGLIDIFRQYGDHLYSKGDHDGAIQQYIKTIGKLEASYVIRKVLYNWYFYRHLIFTLPMIAPR